MATKASNTSVVKAAKNELAVANAQMPEHMRNDALANSGAGLEDITKSDMTIPRLAIAQDTHDQIKNPNKRVKGLESGDFFETISNEIFKQRSEDSKPLLVTPLFFRKNRRYFSPRSEGSKTLCVSENALTGGRFSKLCANCQFAQWTVGPDGAPVKPKCTLFYNYIIVIHHEDGRHFMPMMLTLKGMMANVGKDWNGMLKRAGGASGFTTLFELSTFYDDSSAAGGFWNLKVKPMGFIENPTAYQNSRNLYIALQDKAETLIQANQDNAPEDDKVHEAEVVDDDAPF